MTDDLIVSLLISVPISIFHLFTLNQDLRGDSSQKRSKSFSKKKETGCRWTGWIQIVCGVISLLFGVSITTLTVFEKIPETRLAEANIPFEIVSWPIWGGGVSNAFLILH